MSDLATPRQRQVLELIRRQIERAGAPPTRAEIARELGFRSANAAEQHLRALEAKGLVALVRGAARGIRLLDPETAPGLPVVGRVAAGSPILAQEHLEERYAVDPGLFQPRADYLLRVHGLSMRDAGILDGDLLAVHRTPEAENGQIVVARLADEVTVKRFRRNNRWRHRVQLLPANADFAPIDLDLRHQELVIEGLGVGVLRDRLTRRL